MHASGAPVKEIRAAIDQAYGTRYGRRTPTPPVPGP